MTSQWASRTVICYEQVASRFSLCYKILQVAVEQETVISTMINM